MKLLILYATNSGSTEMAANEIMQHLSNHHEVTLKRVNEATADDIKNAEAVILGSPSWDHQGKDGQPHDDFFTFKDTIDSTVFSGKPVAIFGCGDSSYKTYNGSVDELTQWVTGWGSKIIVEPLKMDKYYYQLAQNQELIQKWTDAFPKTL